MLNGLRGLLLASPSWAQTTDPNKLIQTPYTMPNQQGRPPHSVQDGPGNFSQFTSDGRPLFEGTEGMYAQGAYNLSKKRWNSTLNETKKWHWEMDGNLSGRGDYTAHGSYNQGRQKGYGDTSKIRDDNRTHHNGSTICEGNGFLCVFPTGKLSERFGGLTPSDFNWYVVNYTHPVNPVNNLTNILDCTLHITHPKKDMPKPYYFHVPTGPQYFAEHSKTACDLNSVFRDINDTTQVLHDRITVYGNTALAGSTLVGDQVLFTCGCETTLRTAATVTAKQGDGSLFTAMASDESSRVIDFELKIYSDPLLENMVNPAVDFPRGSQHFFIAAQHKYKEDWTVQAQINKCMACYNGRACRFDSAKADDIVFFDDCDVLYGGPQMRAVDRSSWYYPTMAVWSDNNPKMCPYHVIGIQKFRMSGTVTMQLACRITACSQRPCIPCASMGSKPHMHSYLDGHTARTRRRKLAISQLERPDLHRHLQANLDFPETTVSTQVRFAPEDFSGQDLTQMDSNGSKSASGPSTLIIILAAILVLVTVSVLVYQKQRAEFAKQMQQVQVEERK